MMRSLGSFGFEWLLLIAATAGCPGQEEPSVPATRITAPAVANGASVGSAQAAPAAPQAAAAPDEAFKMPCPQVLQLGLDSFSEAYGTKLQDHSEQAQDRAARFYADCQGAENQPRLAALPPTMRTPFTQLDAALGRWEDAYYGVAYFGGTAALHSAARAGAARQDLYAKVLGLLGRPATPAADIAGKKKAVEKFLAQFLKDSAKPSDSLDPADKKSYLDAYAALKQATSTLDKSLQSFPAQGVGPVLDYLKGHCEGECAEAR